MLNKIFKYILTLFIFTACFPINHCFANEIKIIYISGTEALINSLELNIFEDTCTFYQNEIILKLKQAKNINKKYERIYWQDAYKGSNFEKAYDIGNSKINKQLRDWKQPVGHDINLIRKYTREAIKDYVWSLSQDNLNDISSRIANLPNKNSLVNYDFIFVTYDSGIIPTLKAIELMANDKNVFNRFRGVISLGTNIPVILTDESYNVGSSVSNIFDKNPFELLLDNNKFWLNINNSIDPYSTGLDFSKTQLLSSGKYKNTGKNEEEFILTDHSHTNSGKIVFLNKTINMNPISLFKRNSLSRFFLIFKGISLPFVNQHGSYLVNSQKIKNAIDISVSEFFESRIDQSQGFIPVRDLRKNN